MFYLSNNAFGKQSQFQSKSLLEFAFNEYLLKTELKSVAIKHLRSLGQGLFKLYNHNKEANYYVRFMIKLFDFECEELDD